MVLVSIYRGLSRRSRHPSPAGEGTAEGRGWGPCRAQDPDEDPKLYENKVAQLTVEDDLYGLLSATTNPEEREKVRPKLKELLQKMVTLNIQEREQRIARLREQLSSEEQRLAADKGRTESFVNNRVEQMIAEGTGALRRDMMPRQEGRRQRPTSQPAGRPPR